MRPEDFLERVRFSIFLTSDVTAFGDRAHSDPPPRSPGPSNTSESRLACVSILTIRPMIFCLISCGPRLRDAANPETNIASPLGLETCFFFELCPAPVSSFPGFLSTLERVESSDSEEGQADGRMRDCTGERKPESRCHVGHGWSSKCTMCQPMCVRLGDYDASPPLVTSTSTSVDIWCSSPQVPSVF